MLACWLQLLIAAAGLSIARCRAVAVFSSSSSSWCLGAKLISNSKFGCGRHQASCQTLIKGKTTELFYFRKGKLACYLCAPVFLLFGSGDHLMGTAPASVGLGLNPHILRRVGGVRLSVRPTGGPSSPCQGHMRGKRSPSTCPFHFRLPPCVHEYRLRGERFWVS